MTIRAYDLAAGRPWLIQSDALETILSVADRLGDPEALAAKIGRPLDNTRTVEKRDGVAVVPIAGPIFRYANVFTSISGATSTQVLATDIQAALDDPTVKSIVLNIDSPGGDANGINEMAQMVFDARAVKPVHAYIGGTGASAAYWIASAANSITIDATAMVGSIGVVMTHKDTSIKDAKSDIKTLEIVSSASPDKRIDPTTEAGRAKVQATVDALAEVFINSVARNRGVSIDKVKNDFGRGGVLVGTAAVSAGMADSVGSLESVIVKLASAGNPKFGGLKMSTTAKGAVTVSTTDDLRTVLAAGYAAENISIDISAAVSKAKSEAHAAGLAEGKAMGATEAAINERARLSALHEIAEEGFEAELKAAIDSGASPEAFALVQLKAAKDRGISLCAIKKDSKAAAHAAPADASAKTEANKSWAKVITKFGGK